MALKTKEELQKMLTKRNREIIRQCIFIVETISEEYILHEEKTLKAQAKLMVTRGKQFYKDELKDIRLKLKYIKLCKQTKKTASPQRKK